MSQKTKIKKDFIGLYVIVGGYISRPFAGTIFNEGDEVKTHHFGGSCSAGVTFNDTKLKFNTYCDTANYEIWTTTGISSYEYKDKVVKSDGYYYTGNSFEDYLSTMTEWYKNNEKGLNGIHKKNNDIFKETHLK